MRYDDLFRLDEQTAMIFGGYGGIGSELCRGLAHFGANIVVAGRNPEKAEKLAQEIEVSGREALGLSVDATEANDVGQMVQSVVERFGRIDIMVNCVGAQVDRPAEDYTEEDWDRIVGVNLKAAFLTAQAVGKIMIKQKRGKIIILTSVRSALGIRSGFVAYCSAKGGMNMLTKQLATEWAKYNINVNAVAPGYVNTYLVEELAEKGALDIGEISTRTPLGRLAEPEEIATTVIFLASDDAKYMEGQTLVIDGGWSAYGYLESWLAKSRRTTDG